MSKIKIIPIALLVVGVVNLLLFVPNILGIGRSPHVVGYIDMGDHPEGLCMVEDCWHTQRRLG